MSNPSSSKRPPRDHSATQSLHPGPALNKGGGRRTLADEPLVRPSRKAPTNKARGVYAPVGQDHEFSDDAYHDNSPPPTESDFDSEPESQPPKSKASRKNGAVAVGADAEKGESDEPQPSRAWSTTKKLVVGGLVLLALLLIIVLIFLVTNGTSSSSSSNSESTASHSGQSNATASSHSTATESSHTTNSTSSEAHTSPETSHLESVSSALLSGSLSSQVNEKTAASVIAGVTSAEAESPTATTANVVTSDHAVATAVSTGTPFLDSSLEDYEGLQTIPALSTFSDSPEPTPSETTGEKSTRPATSTATGAAGVPGTTKMTTTATWFGASQHLSACHEIFGDSAMAAAVSPMLFGSDGSSPSELCGVKIRVWQPNSKKTITLSIMDVCNTCPKATAIDLTQGAFLKLAPGGKKDPDAALEKGVLSVQWWFEDPAMQAKLPIGFEEWDEAEWIRRRLD
ncbi:hypothetical protein B0A53_03335 [Rhodotorula sp. CCFEE 5036]|nr:hypothetical protein B0A53_03335 [Rhodotorula sp. CCFEE 5036]